MHDLVLVNTPIHDYSRYPRFRSSYSTPVGLLFLATAARAAGLDVTILDGEAEQLSPGQLVDRLARLSAPRIGFNAFSINASVLEAVLALFPPSSPQIILGGPHVTAAPLSYVVSRLRRANILIRGDAEHSLVALLRGTSPLHVAGAVVPTDDGYAVGPDPVETQLDTLPIPDRNLLHHEPYLKDGLRWFDISISRGCVFACAFCSGSCKSNGSTYRQRDIHLVREELLYLAHRGAQAIEIVDDLPFRTTADFRAFLSQLASWDLGLTWELNLPVAFLRFLRDDDCDLMVTCGIRRLSFGIESGDPVLRHAMGKSVSDSDLVRVVSALSRRGLSAKGYFVVGFPGETAAQTASTVALARHLFEVGLQVGSAHFRPRIFIYKPMPGSALWTRLKADGHSDESLLAFDDFPVDVSYYRKHAWGTVRSYGELSASDLVAVVNGFYNGLPL